MGDGRVGRWPAAARVVHRRKDAVRAREVGCHGAAPRIVAIRTTCAWTAGGSTDLTCAPGRAYEEGFVSDARSGGRGLVGRPGGCGEGEGGPAGKRPSVAAGCAPRRRHGAIWGEEGAERRPSIRRSARGALARPCVPPGVAGKWAGAGGLARGGLFAAHPAGACPLLPGPTIGCRRAVDLRALPSDGIPSRPGRRPGSARRRVHPDTTGRSRPCPIVHDQGKGGLRTVLQAVI